MTFHLQRCDAAIDATRVLERGVLWMASDGAGRATTKRSKTKRRWRRVARAALPFLPPLLPCFVRNQTLRSCTRLRSAEQSYMQSKD